MAITQMDVLKDVLEVMGVEDDEINSIAKRVIFHLQNKEVEEEEEERKGKRRAAKEQEEDKKESLANGDMSKLSKKEQRKLRRKMKKANATAQEQASGEEEEETPKKKGSHLIPKEKVEYPRELLRHKELGALLKSHEKGGEEGRKARKGMRKIGFKLSDQSTWKPFLKAVK